jgi:hypothetical protein
VRAIIERVTCDDCGEIRHFEKFDMAGMTARTEPLTDWLRQYGWTVQENGNRRIDTCPACVARKRD